MKKFLFSALMIACMASCTTYTTTSTARIEKAPSQLLSATVADVEAMPGRVYKEVQIPKAVMRGGRDNCYRYAEAQALLTEGKNADLLLEPQYTVETKHRILRSTITKITVSGRPANFTGFHSLNDSVWCNPLFRENYGK